MLDKWKHWSFMCQSCSKYGYFFLSPTQTNIPLEVFDQLCCCSIMIIGLVLRPCGFNNHKWLEVLLSVGAKKKKKKKKRSGWCNSSFTNISPGSLRQRLLPSAQGSHLLQVGNPRVPGAATLKPWECGSVLLGWVRPTQHTCHSLDRGLGAKNSLCPFVYTEYGPRGSKSSL